MASVLTQEVILSFDRWTRRQMPLAPAVKAWKGETAIADPATATVRPGLIAAGKLVLGVFAETIDNVANTATTTLVNVDFIRERVVLWRDNDGTITPANIFSPCFVVDRTAVGLVSTGKSLAGTILAVDPTLGVGFELEGV